MVSVFLSHSWEDKFFARKLAEKLLERGIQVWIDEAELMVGDSLIQKISEAVEKTDYVAAILSHNSVSSPWVQKELQIAMTKEIRGKKVKVLPILLEKCELPEYLRDKLYADFTNPQNFDSSFLMIIRALGISEVQPPVTVQEQKIDLEKVTPFEDLAELEDIVITGADKNQLHRPDPKKLLYNVYFTLSAKPPIEWVQIFEEERRFPRHTMWRKAWIDGKYIVIHCCLDEIEKIHLKDLKQDVANTNKKYREYLHRRALEQLREKKKKEEDAKAIDEIIDKLDFR